MLINIKENWKWGYYNSETKGIIPCRFDKSSDFWKNNFETSLAGFCPECGKEIEADSKYCMYCGYKIT